MKYKTTLTLSILFSLLMTLHAQTSSKNWLRNTAISPDGTQIAFTYNADIYIVAANGGKARRLTVHKGYDTKPVWSHDGKQIAFASNRHGNYDIFVIPSNGGMVKRLTFHSSNDLPSDFSADGQQVLFSSIRLDPKESMLFHDMAELYQVKVSGGRPQQIVGFPANEVRTNQAGDMLFEEVKGYEDQWRKHHTSSVTRDIWIKKADGSYSQLTTFKGEDRNPVFGQGDDFYYLSEQNGTFNVYAGSLNNPGSDRQISNFELHPVRHLSVSNEGLLCYSFNGQVYTQREGEQPKAIQIDVSGDDSLPTDELLFVNGGIREMLPSPNGKEIIFIYRGDLFASSMEGKIIRRLTNTPEQERSLDISKDGRSIVYAGERNNSWNLYELKLTDKDEKYFVNAISIKEEVLLANSAETFQPKYSPDGKEVAFLEERIKLKKINVDSKNVTAIHEGENNYSYADGDQYFEWSPDGKWLAITFFPEAYWVSEVGIIPSSGGDIINISNNGFYDVSPKWTDDGSLLYWESNKSGMHSVAKTGPSEMDVYGVFLNQRAFDKYRLNKDEFELLPDSTEGDEKEEKESDKKKGKKKKKEGEEKESEDKVEPIKIDFDGIARRRVKLSLFPTRLSGAIVGKDLEKLYYLGRTANKADLWELNLRSKEIKSLGQFGWGGFMTMDKDKKNLFVLSSGSIKKVSLSDGKTKGVGISTEMAFNLKEERMHLIDHVSRQVRKKFLDPELHGAPWDTLTNNYKQFVSGLNNDHDFKDVLGELLGELNASHTGARFYSSDRKGDRTAVLGAFYDLTYEGDGLKIDEIMEGSPLIRGDKKIQPGVIIEGIDGRAIKAGENYYPLFNRKAGKVVILALYNPTTGKRWKEQLKPISINAEFELRYQRWIQRNRALVHKLSDNQIGYMHVRGMNDSSFREFLEDVMGKEVNKKALIVDTRSNGGGDLVDDLTTFLSGKKYMEFKRPGKVVGMESQRRWTKPSAMLVGEDNYSDAHCTPAAYKDLEIGKVIGMPVPGTCSFVWWERIQNGIVFGIPNMQVTDIKGDVLENKQLEPDIKVKNDFETISKGEDKQIEAAVNSLLSEIE